MENLAERIRAAVSRIEGRDSVLAEEMEDVRQGARTRMEARTLAGMMERVTGDVELARPELALETIVLRVGRPVLEVFRDEPRLVFRDAESEVWRERLTAAQGHLVPAIRAVGRIEVKHHPVFDWIGTGWLVAEDVVVTNRHVASEFGRRTGSEFVFRQGSGGRRMDASIDFLEEFDRVESLDFRLLRILHIEDENGPDLALLQVEPVAGRSLAAPITLSSDRPDRNRTVAVIGYPARDSRIPDQKLVRDIFGDVFDKKRLAPGQVTGSERDTILHDCSTLGGNSGAVVLDLESGDAVGLHFAGRFLQANFAVAADTVAERLARIGRRVFAGARRRSTARKSAGPAASSFGLTVAMPRGPSRP